MAATSSRSDEDLKGEQQHEKKHEVVDMRPFWKKKRNFGGFFGILSIATTVIYLFSVHFNNVPVFVNSPYAFEIYCPINKVPDSVRRKHECKEGECPQDSPSDETRFLTADYFDPND